MDRRKLIATAVVVLIALAALGAGYALAQTSPDTKVVTKTEEVIPIPGPTEDVTIGETGPDVVADQGQVDETPPGVTPSESEEAQETPPGVGPPLPMGGAQLLSCEQRFVQNFSDRAAGSKVSQVVLHYTVSSPGTLDAIRNLFNTPSFGASSHILLEPLTGRCVQIVPYSKKAWTQGAFNSVSDSVEIVCCTSDPSRTWWLNTKIVKDQLLASWIVDRLRANGLKPNLVDPVECTPKAGVTDHRRLECGNTHTDVGANFPWTKVMDQVKHLYSIGNLRTVWRATSGGVVLAQKGPKDGRSAYKRINDWLRAHPAQVNEAEKKNGSVKLIKALA